MTEQTEYTPGPWSIHNNIGRKSELGIIATTAPFIIATMCNTKEWPTKAKANARLIAASPRLYTSLACLLKMYRDGDVTSDVLSECDAVIAEVEGQ